MRFEDAMIGFFGLFVFYFIKVQLIYYVVLLMISSMTPLYMYKYIFIFFSIIVCHRILYVVPCAIRQDLAAYPFNMSLHLLTPNSQCIHPSLFFPLANRKSVLHVYDSVLQISSPVSYFRFHIQVISNDVCLFLSNLLQLV